MQAQVMAILNVTPDSFYAASRLPTIDSAVRAACQSVADGATILDIGACSTRPNSTPVSQEEEWQRLEPALVAIRKACPEVQLSVDTFRPEIARRAIDTAGPLIINDVTGGCDEMYSVAEQNNLPYVWTLRGDFGLIDRCPEMQRLSLILDPGFGFIGSTEADYDCMRRLDQLCRQPWPVLVGVSRKSMIWRRLGITPEESLTPTQALHMYALCAGARMLRVHDVRDAMHTITLFNSIYNL